jgi:hypothetical protein
MKIQTISAIGLALATTPLSAGPAAAQGGDAAYCHALTEAYQNYASGNNDRHMTFGQNADVSVAIDKCKAGDMSGIPVLEQALKNAKLDLPKHG